MYPFLGESLPTILENELVIHKDKESFLFVPLLALKMQKDLLEIAGWVCPTKKDMGIFWPFASLMYDFSSWMKKAPLTLKETRLLLRCLFNSGNADIYSNKHSVRVKTGSLPFPSPVLASSSAPRGDQLIDIYIRI